MKNTLIQYDRLGLDFSACLHVSAKPLAVGWDLTWNAYMHLLAVYTLCNLTCYISIAVSCQRCQLSAVIGWFTVGCACAWGLGPAWLGADVLRKFPEEGQGEGGRLGRGWMACLPSLLSFSIRSGRGYYEAWGMCSGMGREIYVRDKFVDYVFIIYLIWYH